MIIVNYGYEYEKFYFPSGEMHIKLITPKRHTIADYTWVFEKTEDIVEFLLYSNALKEAGVKTLKITIPFFPFGRQDRVAVFGETFSLKVMCDLVNSLGASYVRVWDPHSDVIPALLNNCKVITQDAIFDPIINNAFDEEDYFLISPDGGALKKIYKLAPRLDRCLGVIECSKLRDVKTGVITETKVYASGFDARLEGSTCIIVDDICDGGRTFIEIAKVLKERYFVNNVVLCVTHGLFTKGMEPFYGIIDEIFTKDGRIK